MEKKIVWHIRPACYETLNMCMKGIMCFSGFLFLVTAKEPLLGFCMDCILSKMYCKMLVKRIYVNKRTQWTLWVLEQHTGYAGEFQSNDYNHFYSRLTSFCHDHSFSMTKQRIFRTPSPHSYFQFICHNQQPVFTGQSRWICSPSQEHRAHGGDTP